MLKDDSLEVLLTSHESAYTLNEVSLQNDQLNGDRCKYYKSKCYSKIYKSIKTSY